MKLKEFLIIISTFALLNTGTLVVIHEMLETDHWFTFFLSAPIAYYLINQIFGIGQEAKQNYSKFMMKINEEETAHHEKSKKRSA